MGTASLLDARNAILREKPDAVKMDLGCGMNPDEGFIGVDFYADAPGILRIDLYSYPWGIESESVDYLRASHFVEHVPDWDAHFTEAWRILKPFGHYEIISPYYMNRRWFQDPDHKQPILQERFLYLSRNWRKAQKLDHYGAAVNFEVFDGAWFERLHEDFDPSQISSYDMQWFKLHCFNVIEDVGLILQKLPMEAEGGDG